MPSKKPKYDLDKVCEAIDASGGVIAAAARSIGMDRSTLYDYAEKYPEVKAALASARETNIDSAEFTLNQFVRGQVAGQTTRERLSAVRFFLRTVGRARGYGDRMDLDHSGGIKIDIAPIPKPEEDD